MGKYPIGYFFGPPYEKMNDSIMRDISAIRFNYGMAECRESKEECLNTLKYYSENDLGCIINDLRMVDALKQEHGWEELIKGMVEDYKDAKGLYEYYVYDEPCVSQFLAISNVMRLIWKLDEKHSGFVNLFPNYASCKQLGATTYEEYIERYINEVKPSYVCYDHYHFIEYSEQKKESVSIEDEHERLIYEAAVKNVARPGFFDNIEIVRELTLKYDLPFRIIVLLVAHGWYRELTEEELRWEVYQSLAYGAKGIMYFTYWPPEWEPVWKYRKAAVEADGSKSQHYYDLEKINPELELVGGILLDKKNIDVYHIGEEIENVSFFKKNDIFLEILGEAVTVGHFEDDYILFANKDFSKRNSIKIVLNGQFDIRKLNKANKGWEIIHVIGNILHIELNAGDGELYRISKK